MRDMLASHDILRDGPAVYQRKRMESTPNSFVWTAIRASEKLRTINWFRRDDIVHFIKGVI